MNKIRIKIRLIFLESNRTILNYIFRGWKMWNGVAEVAGPTEQQWMSLPRVVIVPGEWMPERVK